MLFFPFALLVLFGHCGIYEIVFFICLVLYVLFLYFYLLKHKTRLQQNIDAYHKQKQQELKEEKTKEKKKRKNLKKQKN